MRGEVVFLTGVLLAVPAALHADTAVKCSIKSLAACPKIGCSKPGSPLAVTNSQKRTTAINGSPAKVSFDDLDALQKDVDNKFKNGPITVAGQTVTSTRNMKAAPRKIILSGLKANSGTFSEGNFVELTGFIASTKLPPHPNTGETVNCKLTDEPSNDYHINITPGKNQDETQGVVVEMIPQNPNRKNKDWNLDKLKKIQAQQMPVRIQGRLFFDNEHVPNTKKTGNAGGNPRRFAVWEIHPLASFEVCPGASCTATTGWKALEDWTPTN
jgi:hypothetical protein